MRMRALFRRIASAARARCRPRVAAGVLTPRSSCLPRPLLLTRALLLAGAGSMVLYPASARAATTLQDGLASRGAEVCRLNTYTTLAVTPAALSSAARDAAARARVVAVASPSAVKAWLAVQGDMGLSRMRRVDRGAQLAEDALDILHRDVGVDRMGEQGV